MKAKTLFMHSDLEKVATSMEGGFLTEILEKWKYTDDKKKTDIMENVVVTAVTKSLGEIQIVLPPKYGLAEELSNRFGFGSIIQVSDFGELQDVRISIYNNGLVFKFLMA